MARAGTVMAVIGLAAALLAAPLAAQAYDRGGWHDRDSGGGRRDQGHRDHGHWSWRGHGHRHGHGWGWGHRRHYSHSFVIQPSPYVKIVFRGRPFYYNRGRFYERRVHSYVTVPAPVGITVREIPFNHDTVVIDGTTYHGYDGIYYKGGPAGYQVVSLPIATGPGQPFQVASAPEVKGARQVTINVPNRNGSYTPVELREEHGLYVGPRGEVYSTAPTTDQLQKMYGQ